MKLCFEIEYLQIWKVWSEFKNLLFYTNGIFSDFYVPTIHVALQDAL